VSQRCDERIRSVNSGFAEIVSLVASPTTSIAPQPELRLDDRRCDRAQHTVALTPRARYDRLSDPAEPTTITW